MKRKEKAAETEAALKVAAKRVFAERGYLNTKITDITSEAGRSAGSFYNHFTGKEELLEALIADMSAEGDALASVPGHSADFSDPGAIRFHIAAYFDFYRHHAATLRAVEQAALVNEEFGRRLAKLGEDETQDLLGHLRLLTDAGHSLPASPEESIRMFAGVVDTVTRRRVQEARDPAADPDGDERTIDYLTRFVYRGLTGRDYD